MKYAFTVQPVFAVAVVLASLIAAGCGGPSTKFQGKVLTNGQPIHLDSGETLQLTFIGEGGPGQKIAFQADVHPDGTFTVDGPENKGVPPGKYHMTLTSSNPYAPNVKDRGDKFKAAYADPLKTSLVVDIPAKPPVIVIDVGTGAVSTTP